MGLGRSGSFLVDTRSTTLEPINDTVFSVTTNAVRLEGYGFSEGNFAQVQILVGPDQDDNLWADLVLNGESIRLSANNTQRIIMLEGKYRVHADEGVNDIVIYQEQDSLDLDKNVFYNYTQPAASTGGATGFDLTASDTSSVNMTFTGDSSGGDISADAKVSADVGNTISIHADGLFAAGGGLNIPFSSESADFDVATTHHAYTVISPSESTVVVSLPAATTAANQIYFVQGGGSGTTAVTVDGTDTINGTAGPLNISPGIAAILYCDGIDNWIAVYGQVF